MTDTEPRIATRTLQAWYNRIWTGVFVIRIKKEIMAHFDKYSAMKNSTIEATEAWIH